MKKNILLLILVNLFSSTIYGMDNKLISSGDSAFSGPHKNNESTIKQSRKSYDDEEIAKITAVITPVKKSKKLIVNVKHEELSQNEIQLVLTTEQEFLDTYNSELVNYWFAPQRFEVIQSHQKSLAKSKKEIDPFFVMKAVLQRDHEINKNKQDEKEELFEIECMKIMKNKKCSELEKEQILNHMRSYKDDICKNLWIDSMRNMKEMIQKQVDDKRSCASYLALPYMKQIHTDLELASLWNADKKF